MCRERGVCVRETQRVTERDREMGGGGGGSEKVRHGQRERGGVSERDTERGDVRERLRERRVSDRDD